MKEPLVRSVARGVGRMLPRSWRLRVSAGRAQALSARTRHRLSRLAAGGRPIVAGPYLGEVGFELLYWIPFLRWFAEEFDLGPERLVAVSRGGAASWYAHVASRYCDVFEVIDPAEFKQRNLQRVRELGEQKQIAVTAFDEEIVRAVTTRMAPDAQLLHPSMMYSLFAPFWWGHMPIAWVDAHTRYRRLTVPSLPAALRLPQDFAAVKFYFNDCFADTPETRAIVHDIVAGVTETLPVVSLTTGLEIDDHHAPGLSDAVIQPRFQPRTNLDLQTAIVARARQFVGTYGGFAYLSPFFGVPATAYYTDANGYSLRHLDVARLAIERLGGGDLLDVREAAGGACGARRGGVTCSTR
jgi:hypothetical protein